jgi:hypothetical protein
MKRIILAYKLPLVRKALACKSLQFMTGMHLIVPTYDEGCFLPAALPAGDVANAAAPEALPPTHPAAAPDEELVDDEDDEAPLVQLAQHAQQAHGPPAAPSQQGGQPKQPQQEEQPQQLQEQQAQQEAKAEPEKSQSVGLSVGVRQALLGALPDEVAQQAQQGVEQVPAPAELVDLSGLRGAEGAEAMDMDAAAAPPAPAAGPQAAAAAAGRGARPEQQALQQQQQQQQQAAAAPHKIRLKRRRSDGPAEAAGAPAPPAVKEEAPALAAVAEEALALAPAVKEEAPAPAGVAAGAVAGAAAGKPPASRGKDAKGRRAAPQEKGGPRMCLDNVPRLMQSPAGAESASINGVRAWAARNCQQRGHNQRALTESALPQLLCWGGCLAPRAPLTTFSSFSHQPALACGAAASRSRIPAPKQSTGRPRTEASALCYAVLRRAVILQAPPAPAPAAPPSITEAHAAPCCAALCCDPAGPQAPAPAAPPSIKKERSSEIQGPAGQAAARAAAASPHAPPAQGAAARASVTPKAQPPLGVPGDDIAGAVGRRGGQPRFFLFDGSFYAE